jgi:hypothetical protein
MNLFLTMPKSDKNYDIGMFMVNVKLYTHSGQLMATCFRPGIVQIPYPLQRALDTYIWSWSLVFGYKRDTQTLDFRCFDGFIESSQHPSTTVEVLFYNGLHANSILAILVPCFYLIVTFFTQVELSDKKIQIYSASVSIVSRLHGFRYLMYHWFISSAVLAVLNIAIFEGTGLALALIAFWFYTKMNGTSTHNNIEPEHALFGGSAMDEDPNLDDVDSQA